MKKKISKIFIVHKNIPSLNEIFEYLDDKNVYCSFCKIRLQSLSKKRHYKEKHLNIKQKCFICGKDIKRLTPHLDTHKKKEITSPNFFIPDNKKNIDSFSNNEILINKFIEFQSPLINNIIVKKYENDISTLFKDIYVFKSFQLGLGTHGVVNFGLSKAIKEPLAVKIYEFKFSKYYSKEIEALSKLEKYNIFPKLISKGDFKFDDYIAEKLIGVDLLKLLEFENNYFDPLTILNVAKDMIDCLSYLEKENIAHCDLKEDNFVWNCFDSNYCYSKIVLIDFSCCIFKNKNNQVKKIGSNSYSSLNQTLEKIPNSSDEIESLIYSLIKMSNINLPWFNKLYKDKNEKKKLLILEKENFTIEDYLPSDLKILGLIFNDAKRKKSFSDMDFKLYKDLLDDQINKIKKALNVDYKFILEKRILEILRERSINKEKFKLDNLLFNSLFSGFPKEFVVEYLNKYFNIK